MTTVLPQGFPNRLVPGNGGFEWGRACHTAMCLSVLLDYLVQF
jgi:hypothetical protein